MNSFFLPSWLSSIPSYLISFPLILFACWVTSLIIYRFHASRVVEPTDEENRIYVKDIARRTVREGRNSYSDMFESVEDAALDSGVEVSDAKTFLDEEIGLLIEEQRNWPDVTEVDRLKLAFQALKSKGYYTDFGEICCGGCGYSCAKAEKKKTPDMLGHIIFTYQDVDGALSGDPIYFWYGTTARKSVEVDYFKVATDLYDSLVEQGLKPEWDGTTKDQVRLSINWQVRWDETRAEAA